MANAKAADRLHASEISEHPLAAVIVDAARDRKLPLKKAEQFDFASGS